jgi:hypothetical protein
MPHLSECLRFGTIFKAVASSLSLSRNGYARVSSGRSKGLRQTNSKVFRTRSLKKIGRPSDVRSVSEIQLMARGPLPWIWSLENPPNEALTPCLPERLANVAAAARP